MPEFITSGAVGLLVKITSLIFIAAILNGLMRRASASTRNILWIAVLGAALVLPLFSIVIPTWRIAPPVLATSMPHVVSIVQRDAASKPSAVIKSSLSAAPSPQDTHAAGHSDVLLSASRSTVNWPLIAVAVWLAGVVLPLAQIAFGLRLAGRARRSSHALDGRMAYIAESARTKMRVGRAVEVRIADEESGVVAPIMWGAARPVVLLPAQSKEWPSDCVQAALLHEFAHIQRWDWPLRIAAQVTCALYWFHPLVWMAARQARETSERACDDCVLNAGMPPADYAQRLVDVLRSIPIGAKPPRRAVIAMAIPNETEGRIKAVLTNGLNRQGVTRKWALAGALLALAVVAPTAALRLATKEKAAAIDAAPTSEISYAGGGKVQLLGITDYPAPGKTWWNADGKRLSEPPIDPDPHGGISFTGKYAAHEFAFRVIGAPSDASVTTDTPGQSSGGMWTAADTKATTIAVNALLPSNTRTAAVRVGVASGLWETVDEFGPWGQSMKSSSWRGHDMAIAVSDSSLFSGSAGATVTNTVVDAATRIVAIDKHGVLHAGNSLSGGSSGTTQMRSVNFEGLKISDVKKIMFQARPYEWREFKNLPLQPTQ